MSPLINLGRVESSITPDVHGVQSAKSAGFLRLCLSLTDEQKSGVGFEMRYSKPPPLYLVYKIGNVFQNNSVVEFKFVENSWVIACIRRRLFE